MTIESVKLTDAEIEEAVGVWLAGKGIQVPVDRVRKEYSYSTDWTVTFVDPNPPSPAPAATSETEG